MKRGLWQYEYLNKIKFTVWNAETDISILNIVFNYAAEDNYMIMERSRDVENKKKLKKDVE